jgi:hypothetical protein
VRSRPTHLLYQVRRAATKRAILRCAYQVSAYGDAKSCSGSGLLTLFAQRGGTANLKQNHKAGFIYPPPPNQTPARPAKKNSPPAPAPPTKSRAPKRAAGQKSIPGPPRGSPGVPRKWCYWELFAPFQHRPPTTPQWVTAEPRHPHPPPRGAGRPGPLQIQNAKPPPMGPWWLGASNHDQRQLPRSALLLVH